MALIVLRWTMRVSSTSVQPHRTTYRNVSQLYFLVSDEFESTRERSRLSKTLQDILTDKTALNYFVQYMESRNASPYILCWLDIDTFKSELLNTASKATYSPVPNAKVDHDSLSVSTDCDSYTADSASLFDYSTMSDVGRTSDKDSDDSVTDTESNSIELALTIFKKYIAQEAQHSIKCAEPMRKQVMENICTNQRTVAANCFDAVQTFVYNTLENDYFRAFLATDFFCKHQIDVLTSGNVALDDLLYNETALFYFMEFIEQENQRGLLDFWIAATNFQQQLRDQKEFFDAIEAQSDAIVLYDKYFSLQAHCPLGFGDKVRFEVEQSICGEEGLIVDCFHLPLKIVEHILERNYLKSFLGSQLFYKYLSELINTVQSSGYSTNLEARDSLSECGSERSFSTSTFLALEMDGVVRKEKCGDMSIDTRQLDDPDALWRRRRNQRLICGRISEMGKYETDFEPEPDRKQFTFKDVVRKFVSLEEEHRKKEELAWRVAEMIVKDITSVTLNTNKTEL